MSERMPAEVFHPGEYLLDELNARGWTQKEFAKMIDRSASCVNQIINKKRGISAKTALELGNALGTGPQFWMNLDSAYRIWKKRKEILDREKRQKWLTEQFTKKTPKKRR